MALPLDLVRRAAAQQAVAEARHVPVKRPVRARRRPVRVRQASRARARNPRLRVGMPARPQSRKRNTYKWPRRSLRNMDRGMPRSFRRLWGMLGAALRLNNDAQRQEGLAHICG